VGVLVVMRSLVLFGVKDGWGGSISNVFIGHLSKLELSCMLNENSLCFFLGSLGLGLYFMILCNFFFGVTFFGSPDSISWVNLLVSCPGLHVMLRWRCLGIVICLEDVGEDGLKKVGNASKGGRIIKLYDFSLSENLKQS